MHKGAQAQKQACSILRDMREFASDATQVTFARTRCTARPLLAGSRRAAQLVFAGGATRIMLALCISLLLSATSLPLQAFAANANNAVNEEQSEESNEEKNLVDPTQRADNSFIYDTTVASLFSQASLYEDRTVQVAGEVIGDRIDANDGLIWITLTETNADDKSSISVLTTSEQANQIDHYGRYGVVGTTLQVRGTYHQACEEHDGLPDIHASNSSVLSVGSEYPDELNISEFVPGVIALVIGFGLMSAFYFARERTR